MSEAQVDLKSRVDHVLMFQKDQLDVGIQTEFDERGEVATSTSSMVAGTIAIPAVAALSTTTVSVGGIWGLLGVTTTVISFPVAIVGGVVALGLFAFGRKKSKDLNKKAAAHYRTELRKMIGKRVLCNRNNSRSVCRKLQNNIKKTASEILGDIEV